MIIKISIPLFSESAKDNCYFGLVRVRRKISVLTISSFLASISRSFLPSLSLSSSTGKKYESHGRQGQVTRDDPTQYYSTLRSSCSTCKQS